MFGIRNNIYEERVYRKWYKGEKFKCFMEVGYKETDLYISADKYLDRQWVKEIVKDCYCQIEEYVEKNPLFFSSLSPLAMDKNAPPIVQDMLESSSLAGVGPFSSVAGAISWYIGKKLLEVCEEIIIENGGDVFLKIKSDKIIGVYTTQENKEKMLRIRIKKREYPFGICSSSSQMGHSLNFGEVDLVTVIAKNSVVADAFATAFSNQIKQEEDIEKVMEKGRKNGLIEAMVIVFRNRIALWGDVELIGERRE